MILGTLACMLFNRQSNRAHPGQRHRLQGAGMVAAAAVARKCQGWNQLGARHLNLNMRRQKKQGKKQMEGVKKKEKKKKKKKKRKRNKTESSDLKSQ